MYGYSTELYHHGVKGMRWGVRNYQNADGTLTAEGRQRYGGAYGKKATATGYLKDVQRIHRRVTADTMRQHLKEGLHINKNYRPLNRNHDRLIKSTEAGQKALDNAYKHLNAKYDAKFGKGTSQKLAKRAIGLKAGASLAALAVTAISATAVANTIHQQRTGKSYTQEFVDSFKQGYQVGYKYGQGLGQELRNMRR